MTGQADPAPALVLVLDTNIVLDAFVFNDPATQLLQSALERGQVLWLATAAMREELERVLTYPHITARRVQGSLGVDAVLARFDASARLTEVAPKAGVTCRDPDDQKFIDLAVAHRATLLSKDRAVLCLAKRLLGLGVPTRTAFTRSM